MVGVTPDCTFHTNSAVGGVWEMSVLTVFLLRTADDICGKCVGVSVLTECAGYECTVCWPNVMQNGYEIFDFDWYAFA